MRLYPNRWNKIEPTDSAKALAIGLSLSLTNLLSSRFPDPDELADFLEPKLLDQPMADEIAAAQRIVRAIQERQTIGVFGDYDVDGITSAAIWMRFLRHHASEAIIYLPSRYHEGYGLNPASVGLVGRVDLLITVDCGIGSVAEVAELQAKGIDVIVTDHHEPGDELPDTWLVNPKLGDYPFKQLAGVGVAYKLIRRLAEMGFELPEGLIELTALGTVADVMPLLGENRWLVRHGLAALKQTRVAGLKQLMAELQLPPAITASDLAFRIGPLLNAAGRMASPQPAYQLLVEDDPAIIGRLIEELLQANQARRQATDHILHQLAARLSDVPAMIVEKGSDWLSGVLGLAAARAVEKYRRPVILLNESDELVGSGRTIGQFSILESLKATRAYLSRFGGHQAAAGVALDPADYADFKQHIQAYAGEHLSSDDTERQYDYHPLDISEVRLDLLDQLALLEPFGAGNPAPIFRLDGLKLERMRLMGRHRQAASLEFLNGNRHLRVVSFDITDHDWQVGQRYDLLVRLSGNFFQGVMQLQILLVDYRLSQFRLTPASPAFEPELERLWQLVLSYQPEQEPDGPIDLVRALETNQTPATRLGRLNSLEPDDLAEFIRHLPTRPDLVAGYRQLKKHSSSVDLRAQADPLRLCLQLKLFESLGLLTYTKHDFDLHLQWHDQTTKLDLFSSPFYRQSQRILEDYHELD